MKLILILGDQLNHDSEVFNDFDPKRDAVAMVEVMNESKIIWSHKARTAFFLSSMRHFADELREKGVKVYYQKLGEGVGEDSFKDAFLLIVKKLRPTRLKVCEPGEHRVKLELQALSDEMSIPLEICSNNSFFCSTEEFHLYSKSKKNLRMEFFYRELREKHRVLMDGSLPEGGKWNFDHENRKSFGKKGPEKLPDMSFIPDAITDEVIRTVNEMLPDNPGKLKHFTWPVTSRDANKLLEYFIEEKLPRFGDWQDAMWVDEPFLFHSKISAAMNAKLLVPRKVVKAVEEAYHQGRVPLASAEGFIRQILGWREYVRGIYYEFMPNYLDRNFLKANKKLPDFYWTGKTHMNCMSQVIKQTMDHGYAHHIQRLMVTGLFALLYGVNPQEIHRWYLAVYIDAVEWVELPNTLGMSQYADGGVMASKPYIASGKYINRMSNYCKGCKYDPDATYGVDACPFTTLYWDFVRRHTELLKKNPRLGMQVNNWQKKSDEEKNHIIQLAEKLRSYKSGRS